MKITVASVACGPPEILHAFSSSLRRLHRPSLSIEYLVIDDNPDPRSSTLLAEFASETGAEVLTSPCRASARHCDVAGPTSSRASSIRVGRLQDRLVERALERDCDAVLFVDADLGLDPRTLVVLAAVDLDIVAEVFWTRWCTNSPATAPELPNEWEAERYSFVPPAFAASADALDAMDLEFLDRLRVPGVHPVGGLAGCVLVRRRVLEAGVRFAELPNLSWSGHGHAFCVRAAACGVSLWADTHVPPLHLYSPLHSPAARAAGQSASQDARL